jgi:hypothetical protein
MVALIIDDYKLVIFLFEKMGSRSIESAIGGLGDGSGPEGLDIKIIEDAEYITGGLFDYIKYADSYPMSKIMLEGYKKIFIYRDTYKRLVSTFYWIINQPGNYREELNYKLIKYKTSIFPDVDNNFINHRQHFRNFCELVFVKKELYGRCQSCGHHFHFDGHIMPMPLQLLIKKDFNINYKIDLDNIIEDIKPILIELEVENDKQTKFIECLEENKIYFKNKKSIVETVDTFYGVQAQRASDDYYSYYDGMPREILDSINDFYESDLEFTGIKKL